MSVITIPITQTSEVQPLTGSVERERYRSIKIAHFIDEGLDLIAARNMANLMTDLHFHIKTPYQLAASERLLAQITNPLQAEYQRDWSEDQEATGGPGA